MREVYITGKMVKMVFDMVDYHIVTLFNRGVQVSVSVNDVAINVELNVFRGRSVTLSLNIYPNDFYEKYKYIDELISTLCVTDSYDALVKAKGELKQIFSAYV